MAAPSHIFLIICDQMRADCMGIAGHPDVKTPYLDSLALEGTLFSNAYSACPSCIPARAALMTGLSQRNHRRVGYQDGIPWEYDAMLPQRLNQLGWQTECVGKMHVHPPLLSCGFDHIKLHDGYLGYYRNPQKPYWQHQSVHDSYLHFLKQRQGPDADVNDCGPESNSWITQPWIYDQASHPTNWAVTESIRSLQMRDRSRPFFLMTSFVRPHPPFDAPAEYLELYRHKALREPAGSDWQASGGEDDRRYDSRCGCRDTEVRQLAMAGYYACITHMDHQIGRLLQAIQAEGILEDSIILFTSDHGEELFDHGLFRKARPYQGSIHIPLIVRVGKNIRSQQQPAVCTDVVELRDILPTLLSYAGQPVRDTDGVDLRPILEGESAQSRNFLHGEHSYGEMSSHFIVTQQDKYIWYSQTGQEQYFRLCEDPREQHDAIQEPGARPRVEQLRSLLIRQLEGREEGFTDGRQLFTGKHTKKMLSGHV